MRAVRAPCTAAGPLQVLSNPVTMARNMKENVLGKDEKSRKKSTARHAESRCVFRKAKRHKVKMHKTKVIKHIKVTKRRKIIKLY